MNATLLLQSSVSPLTEQSARAGIREVPDAENLGALWRRMFERVSLVGVPPPLVIVPALPVQNASATSAGASLGSSTQPSAVVGSSALEPWAAARAASGTKDSVFVFVNGASVAIVVRDAVLSEEKARHAGFETARHLRGHSAALRELTLNGRTLYRQPADPAPQGRECPVSTLLFGC